MPSPLRGRTRAQCGTPRSCLHHSADELGPSVEHHAHALTTPRTNSGRVGKTTLMPSPLRGRTRAQCGTPRSRLHHSADELRIETMNFPPQDPPGVEEMVAHGRLAAAQD